MSDLSAFPSVIQRTSLHEEVASRLRAMIFDGRLAPASRIDELGLAREWGISRTPLREALKVLANEGLVELQPRRGCQVVQIDDDEAQHLFPVMALLEGRCAREAARRASDAELGELATLHAVLEECAAAGDIDGYYRANHVFHRRVQALAGNRWLDRATSELRKIARLLRGRQLKHPGRLAASIEEHRRLLDALLRRDADAAEQLMHDHLMAQLQALQAMRAEAAAGQAVVPRLEAGVPLPPALPTGAPTGLGART